MTASPLIPGIEFPLSFKPAPVEVKRPWLVCQAARDGNRLVFSATARDRTGLLQKMADLAFSFNQNLRIDIAHVEVFQDYFHGLLILRTSNPSDILRLAAFSSQVEIFSKEPLTGWNIVIDTIEDWRLVVGLNNKPALFSQICQLFDRHGAHIRYLHGEDSVFFFVLCFTKEAMANKDSLAQSLQALNIEVQRE